MMSEMVKPPPAQQEQQEHLRDDAAIKPPSNTGAKTRKGRSLSPRQRPGKKKLKHKNGLPPRPLPLEDHLQQQQQQPPVMTRQHSARSMPNAPRSTTGNTTRSLSPHHKKKARSQQARSKSPNHKTAAEKTKPNILDARLLTLPWDDQHDDDNDAKTVQTAPVARHPQSRSRSKSPHSKNKKATRTKPSSFATTTISNHQQDQQQERPLKHLRKLPLHQQQQQQLLDDSQASLAHSSSTTKRNNTSSSQAKAQQEVQKLLDGGGGGGGGETVQSPAETPKQHQPNSLLSDHLMKTHDNNNRPNMTHQSSDKTMDTFKQMTVAASDALHLHHVVSSKDEATNSQDDATTQQTADLPHDASLSPDPSSRSTEKKSKEPAITPKDGDGQEKDTGHPMKRRVYTRPYQLDKDKNNNNTLANDHTNTNIKNTTTIANNNSHEYQQRMNHRMEQRERLKEQKRKLEQQRLNTLRQGLMEQIHEQEEQQREEKRERAAAKQQQHEALKKQQEQEQHPSHKSPASAVTNAIVSGANKLVHKATHMVQYDTSAPPLKDKSAQRERNNPQAQTAPLVNDNCPTGTTNESPANAMQQPQRLGDGLLHESKEQDDITTATLASTAVSAVNHAARDIFKGFKGFVHPAPTSASDTIDSSSKKEDSSKHDAPASSSSSMKAEEECHPERISLVATEELSGEETPYLQLAARAATTATKTASKGDNDDDKLTTNGTQRMASNSTYRTARLASDDTFVTAVSFRTTKTTVTNAKSMAPSSCGLLARRHQRRLGTTDDASGNGGTINRRRKKRSHSGSRWQELSRRTSLSAFFNRQYAFIDQEQDIGDFQDANDEVRSIHSLPDRPLAASFYQEIKETLVSPERLPDLMAENALHATGSYSDTQTALSTDMKTAQSSLLENSESTKFHSSVATLITTNIAPSSRKLPETTVAGGTRSLYKTKLSLSTKIREYFPAGSQVRSLSIVPGVDVSEFQENSLCINADSFGISPEMYLQMVVDSFGASDAELPYSSGPELQSSSKDFPEHSSGKEDEIYNRLSSTVHSEVYFDASETPRYSMGSDSFMDAMGESFHSVDAQRHSAYDGLLAKQVSSVQEDFYSQFEKLDSNEQDNILKKIRSLSVLGCVQFDVTGDYEAAPPTETTTPAKDDTDNTRDDKASRIGELLLDDESRNNVGESGTVQKLPMRSRSWTRQSNKAWIQKHKRPRETQVDSESVATDGAWSQKTPAQSDIPDFSDLTAPAPPQKQQTPGRGVHENSFVKGLKLWQKKGREFMDFSNHSGSISSCGTDINSLQGRRRSRSLTDAEFFVDSRAGSQKRLDELDMLPQSSNHISFQDGHRDGKLDSAQSNSKKEKEEKERQSVSSMHPGEIVRLSRVSSQELDDSIISMPADWRVQEAMAKPTTKSRASSNFVPAEDDTIYSQKGRSSLFESVGSLPSQYFDSKRNLRQVEPRRVSCAGKLQLETIQDTKPQNEPSYAPAGDYTECLSSPDSVEDDIFAAKEDPSELVHEQEISPPQGGSLTADTGFASGSSEAVLSSSEDEPRDVSGLKIRQDKIEPQLEIDAFDDEFSGPQSFTGGKTYQSKNEDTLSESNLLEDISNYNGSVVTSEQEGVDNQVASDQEDFFTEPEFADSAGESLEHVVDDSYPPGDYAEQSDNVSRSDISDAIVANNIPSDVDGFGGEETDEVEPDWGYTYRQVPEPRHSKRATKNRGSIVPLQYGTPVLVGGQRRYRASRKPVPHAQPRHEHFEDYANVGYAYDQGYQEIQRTSTWDPRYSVPQCDFDMHGMPQYDMCTPLDPRYPQEAGRNPVRRLTRRSQAMVIEPVQRRASRKLSSVMQQQAARRASRQDLVYGYSGGYPMVQQQQHTHRHSQFHFPGQEDPFQTHFISQQPRNRRTSEPYYYNQQTRRATDHPYAYSHVGRSVVFAKPVPSLEVVRDMSIGDAETDASFDHSVHDEDQFIEDLPAVQRRSILPQKKQRNFSTARLTSSRNLEGDGQVLATAATEPMTDVISNTNLRTRRDSQLDADKHGKRKSGRSKRDSQMEQPPLYERPDLRDHVRDLRRRDINLMGTTPSFFEDHMDPDYDFVYPTTHFVPRMTADGEHDDYAMTAALRHRQWVGMPKIRAILDPDDDYRDLQQQAYEPPMNHHI